MIEIISAEYGGKDVTSIVRSRVKDDKLLISASNENFGDPSPGKVKILTVNYIENEETKIASVGEGRNLAIPKSSYTEPIAKTYTDGYQYISCKCITYGRVDLLEESLKSFLQQDYPSDRYEMVIINDYPLQKLVFDHPQVRIFNLDTTFNTIGDKENFATEQCKGEIICQWDDDDLALSNHLQNVNKFFIPESDLLHWQRACFMNVPVLEGIVSVGNSGIVYSKKIWRELDGYPLENAGYDMSFVLNIKRISKNIVLASPPDDEASWIYCWGGRGYHMSGMGTDDGTRPNVIIRHVEHIERLRKSGKIPTGEIQLNPNWKHDYNKIFKEYVSRFHNTDL